MAIINQAVAGGAQFVARAVEYQIRQAVTSSAESSTTSAASTTSPFSSPSPAGTVTPSSIGTVPSPTTPAPSATTTSSGKSGGGGGTSSPLLFFVALGFGVVFTNLWIIVGVKYCFRYNARNRQMRGLDENGEPINLENMPTRPHRRRREKKLMTMDEVNDKFPMMKYKTWVLERAREGLPTTGGVSAPGSRANSVVSVEGIVPEINAKEREVPESRADTGAARTSSDREGDQPRASSDNLHASPENGAAGDLAHTGALTQSQTVQTVASTIVKEEETRGSVDEEEDEQINAALPPELMGTSGDTCAICIDTLEDDDDVRGLTCGHAFHAVCLDPWLTNRRACCPLCKADYYTPKPRNAPAEADPNNPASANPGDPSRNNGRMNMPRAPQRSFTSWTQFREAPRLILPTRFGGTMGAEPVQARTSRRRERQRPQRSDRRQTRTQAPPIATEDNENGNALTRFRGRFPPFRLNQLMRRNREEQATPTNGADAPNASPATPSQLEAGVQPSTTATT